MANADTLTREISNQGLHEAGVVEERAHSKVEHHPPPEPSSPARKQLLHLATYAQTRTTQVLRQALQAIVARDSIELQVATFASRLQRDEQRMADVLGRPVGGLQVLELGAGQQCERARYFGQLNCVTAVDLDWIPRNGGVFDYLLMLRRNGIARLVKTAGRKMLLVDRTRRNAWARAVGTAQWFRDPMKLHGNVCIDPLPREAFDLITSWSLFEHLSDPAAALRNAWQALRPGGALYIGIHLYTATNGHHDFRHSATEGQITAASSLAKMSAHQAAA